jgi:transcription termination/antitermination protein NusG
VELEAGHVRERAMTMKWFVVHTYSGQENRAKLNLVEKIRQSGMTDQFGEVLIPT